MKTVEPQYQRTIEIDNEEGRERLGLMTNQVWSDDPRRLLFVLSRYKFAAKMLEGLNDVLEVGCADAFGTRIVQQSVGSVTALDFDPVFIEDVNNRQSKKWKMKTLIHDMLKGPIMGRKFSGAYSIDVLEHIKPQDEHIFISNIVNSLEESGVLLLGSPSSESQPYASLPSKLGHVNCKSGPELKNLMKKYFNNVFIFSMNDEVIHTGFHSMSHYLFALCCSPKKS